MYIQEAGNTGNKEGNNNTQKRLLEGKKGNATCKAGLEAAGHRKSIDFQFKSFEKVSILSSRPGREWPGDRKIIAF